MKDRASVVAAARAGLELCQSMVLDKVVLSQFPEIVRGYWRDVLPLRAGKPVPPPYPPQWCGAFALSCLHRGGLGSQLFWAFGPPNYGFLWKLQQLERHVPPEPGDVAYLDKPFQHHAIVCHVAGAIVATINGNQGAAEPVKYYEHPLEHWTAYYSIARLLPSENVA